MQGGGPTNCPKINKIILFRFLVGFSRPGSPWNRSAADCSSGLQCSIPISVDFGPKTDRPGVFGHYYYSVFVWEIIIWPVKRCRIGIFHIGMCHLDIVDTVDTVDTADIVHTVDTLDILECQ